MLTNYKTIRKRINRLKDLEKMEEDGIFDLLPKKEVINLRHEMERLEKFLGGIKEMDKLPDLLFVIDPKKEKIAVSEAKILGICKSTPSSRSIVISAFFAFLPSIFLLQS